MVLQVGGDIEMVQKEAMEMLPGYMQPRRWLALDDLPKTPNGKIDRQSLLQLFE